MSSPTHPRALTAGILAVLVLFVAVPAGAQTTDPPADTTAAMLGPRLPADTVMMQDTVPAEIGADITPLGAFLRALVLPTWGHGSIGSHRRGTFYMLAEGGTAWMLFKTVSRQRSADRVLAARRARAVAELSLTTTDPLELEELVAQDPLVDDAQRRVDARQGHFEDWVAMGIFLTFLSGADAFVSAHLRDFPDPIEVGVGPSPEGGVQVGARLKLGAFFR